MLTDSPFLDAQGSLDEAVAWLQDLMLPAGRPPDYRHDDMACLDEAMMWLDHAINGLCDYSTEQVYVGSYDAEGSVPEIDTRVVDPQAAQASERIAAMVEGLRQWRAGGAPVVITPSLIESIKSALEPFSDRLAGEREYVASLPDDAPH